MESTRQRKILVIVSLVCSVVTLLALLALNAFRLSSLNPVTTTQIVAFVAISFVASLLFVAALVLLVRNALKLYAEQRSRVLGARLRTRMLWGAILISLVPIGSMYVFSYLLLNRAVDRWFSQPATQLRDDSSRVALDLSRYVAANARAEAEAIAASLLGANGRAPSDAATINRQLRAHEATLQGGFVVVYRDARPVTRFRVPVPHDGMAQMSTLQTLDGSAGEADSTNSRPVRGALDVLVLQAAQRADEPIVTVAGADYIIGSAWVKGDALIATAMPLPVGMSGTLIRLHRSGEQYWTLFRLRRQVRTTYMLLMLMMTSLALFASSWLALHLSKLVTRPVEALADAMAAIAHGNYDQRVEGSATEELGELVQSFNTMAEDLEGSRRLAERSTVQLFEANVELELRRRELETMLQTIPNGVVMLDSDERVRVANRAFSEMLDPGGQHSFVGRPLRDTLPQEEFETLERLLQRSHRMGTASSEMELHTPAAVLHIAATVALLENEAGGQRTVTGYVLVLENATELLHAQKQSAWKEVARRVAHEIKNPLTPIALSAEQIRRHIGRLGEQISAAGIESPSIATIHRSSEVISSAVGSLRSLVDQFSSLAEFPNSHPRPSEINGIIDATLAFFSGRLEGIRVVRALTPDLPPIMADPEAIKRALSNLIDNAAEAMGSSLRREIRISTALSIAAPGMVEIAIADSGPGVTNEMRERLFLPYFSTKQRGTGLGLTIAAKIVSEHQGSIRVEKNAPTGARFILELPTAPSHLASGVEAQPEESHA